MIVICKWTRIWVMMRSSRYISLNVLLATKINLRIINALVKEKVLIWVRLSKFSTLLLSSTNDSFNMYFYVTERWFRIQDIREIPMSTHNKYISKHHQELSQKEAWSKLRVLHCRTAHGTLLLKTLVQRIGFLLYPTNFLSNENK